MKFSIVICTYNREKYIGGCLESVCVQTYPNNDYEVIVVDNNSPDRTKEICSKFSQKYPNISFRYILETEQGISFARNRGIAEAKSEYIVFIDDDETVDTFYLERLGKYLEQYPQAELCCTQVLPIYENTEPKWLSKYTMRLVTGYFNKGNEVKVLTPKDYPGTGHAIIKKDIFIRFGNFNTDLGRKGSSLLGAEDKDMFLRLMENKVACYYFPDIPIYHHIPDSKLSNEFFSQLTFSIGKSERIRTKNISDKAFCKRMFSEGIKWTASILLFFFYLLAFSPSKGVKLLQFRWNVSKGLLGK